MTLGYNLNVRTLSYTISSCFKEGTYLPYQNDFKWLNKWACNKKAFEFSYFVTTLRNCIFQKDALSK